MGYRQSKMCGRGVSGLLSGVAVVLLLLLQGAHSVYIQVSPSGHRALCLKVRRGRGGDGEGTLGNPWDTGAQVPRAHPNPESQPRDQDSWRVGTARVLMAMTMEMTAVINHG